MMDSIYGRELEEWIKTKGIKKQGANLAAFLSVRDLVKARLDEGYSVTVIFAYLHDTKQIDVCYDTFLKYVQRHLRPARKRGQVRVALPPKELIKKAGDTSARANAPDAATAMKGFVFNAVPNKKDLL